jgi:hypothetical protein
LSISDVLSMMSPREPNMGNSRIWNITHFAGRVWRRTIGLRATLIKEH